MFYSDFEINTEITKNIFSKIKNYDYKSFNKISIEKNLHNINYKFDKDNKELRKKFNINKTEQFFWGFLDFCSCLFFCKTHRTVRLLNLCSDFVQTYLSAENIIFNMILFENYYMDNPIKYKINSYLNKIDFELEDKIIFGENEKEGEEDKKDIGENFISINDNE